MSDNQEKIKNVLREQRERNRIRSIHYQLAGLALEANIIRLGWLDHMAFEGQQLWDMNFLIDMALFNPMEYTSEQEQGLQCLHEMKFQYRPTGIIGITYSDRLEEEHLSIFYNPDGERIRCVCTYMGFQGSGQKGTVREFENIPTEDEMDEDRKEIHFYLGLVSDEEISNAQDDFKRQKLLSYKASIRNLEEELHEKLIGDDGKPLSIE